ncbi:glycosyltransferase family 2 protein [Thiohalobacter sp. IOR34]|uniref:glycosyltransferase family 2 protein n=1 Tax=Thiohalobacter sp. IOR34 TaxID=3057176 RepID=UPI0025B12FB2|nr:glycosyltransferase family 2 protein [Thiohalobacter sp. IOR34]WJW76296.1 glycosyltransferase family 2 protein [Thiohalobacter sp. IOR34]
MSIKLSIIIVSWNCKGVLRDCLKSLDNARLDFRHEILVVDNASRDGTLDMVRVEFPKVDTIASDENLGFARANNLGIQQTTGEYILLLNPDTLIEQAESISRLVEFLDQHPDISAAGCKLLHEDGRHQVGDAGYCPTLTSIAAHSLFIGKLFPGSIKSVYLPEVKHKLQSLPVDWICGACFLFRRSLISKIGLMREDIFMYGEDMEWCCRIRNQDMHIHYLPGVTITHIQGGTQAQESPTSCSWILGLARTYVETNTRSKWLTFKLILMTGFTIRLFLYILGYALTHNKQYHTRHLQMHDYLRYTLALKKADLGILSHAGNASTADTHK